ncbi:MAG TPA: hypothetical protein VFP56_07305 [Candidatus Limnocylindrales bacterium]|nr:hypothetical protein [Candidatus Limnocylindrales bacterium]
MSEAFDRVLQLVAQGKLSAEEAAPILEALERKPKSGPGAPMPPMPPQPPQFGADLGPTGGTPGSGPRFARVEVREHGRRVVDLRIPISLGRFALSRVPGLSTEQIAEVEEAVTSGAHGPILDVQDPDGDGVRIVLE